MVWSLIQGLQVCKLRSYRLCIIAMVHLKLVNLFVEKQIMLPAASELLLYRTIMCLILHCSNETCDLFDITAAQTVENNAQQRILSALFWPSPGCRHIYVSYSVVCWVFSTILTLHAVYYHTLIGACI